MGIFARATVVAAIAGAAYAGFYYGERLAIPDSYRPAIMTELDAGSALCTFYPVFLHMTEGNPRQITEREFHSAVFILSDPALTPYWLNRYAKTFENRGVAYEVEGNALRIPCQYYDDLSILMTYTDDAADDEWLEKNHRK